MRNNPPVIEVVAGIGGVIDKGFRYLIPVGTSVEGFNKGREKDPNDKDSYLKGMAKSSAVMGGFGAAFGQSYMGKSYNKKLKPREDKYLKALNKAHFEHPEKLNEKRKQAYKSLTEKQLKFDKYNKWKPRIKGGLGSAAANAALYTGAYLLGKPFKKKKQVENTNEQSK